MVDASDAVLAGYGVQPFDQLDAAEGVAVERHRRPAFEPDGDVGGLVGRAVRRPRPGVGVLGRLVGQVFEHAAFDAAAPEVLVDGEWLLQRHRHRNAVALGVGDLLGPVGHVPLAGGRDNAEAGVEGAGAHVEPHLVVALGGAAVGDGGGPLLTCHADHQLGNQGAAQSGAEGIDALVHGVGVQRRKDEVVDEPRTGVLDVGRRRSRRQRLLPRRAKVDVAAEVGGDGDHVHAVVLLQPANGDGRVEPAAVRQYDLIAHWSPSSI